MVAANLLTQFPQLLQEADEISAIYTSDPLGVEAQNLLNNVTVSFLNVFMSV